jgi:hypothetical protein
MERFIAALIWMMAFIGILYTVAAYIVGRQYDPVQECLKKAAPGYTSYLCVPHETPKRDSQLDGESKTEEQGA